MLPRQALAPYVTQVLGIDLSTSMVSVYNKNASNQGLSPSEMSASVGNLLDPDDPSPADFNGEDWFGFDLAVVCLGFHHFEDPAMAAARLARRLKPGGVLLIIDFMPHGDHEGIEPDSGDSAEGGPSHGHGLRHGPGGPNHEHAKRSKEEFQKVMGTVAHSGFAKEDIQNLFEMSGVGKDFGFDVLKNNVVFRTNDRKITRQVFFARGTKV